VRSLASLPAGEAFDAVLLGIKPQLLADVAPAVAPFAGAGTVALSMLAGVELAVLQAHFPQAGGLVRMMPNLSAALGKSPIALAEHGLDAAGSRGQ
jgi:pyrroline-5-carboxylate reductase